MNGTDRRMYTPLSVGIRVAMVIVLFTTCGGGVPSDPLVASISGHVTEVGTGKALAGVSIQTDPSTSSPTTDATGWYPINRPEPGPYVVQATLAGYFTSTKSILVGVGAHVTADLQMVKIVAVASVSISSGPATLGVGQIIVVTATPRDAAGNALTGRAIEWSTNAPSTVSISTTTGASVTLTGVSSGTATIRATCEGVGGSVEMTVPSPASVALSSGPATLGLGQTLAVTATVRDAGGNVLPGRSLQWTTSNPGAVSLSPTTGATVTLTGVASGTATIRATSEGASGSVVITVPVPATVSLSSGPVTVVTGQAITIVATVRDNAGNAIAGRDITWTTSNGAVVGISASTGASTTLTALAAGTSTIHAACESASASIVVTVPPPAAVAAITVTASRTALVVGDSAQITAVPRDSAGQPLANRSVTWITSNAGVASIRGAGATAWFLGIATGTASLSATAGGVTGSTQVTVLPIPVSTVVISPASAVIDKGGQQQLSATARDAAGNVISGVGVTWSSANSNVATVSSSGLVVGVSNGTALISATAGGVSGSALVTVPPAPVATVGITPENPVVDKGGQLQLTATARDAAGTVITGASGTWSSTDAGVATVSSSGLVFGVSYGTASIRAAIGGVTVSTQLTVAAGGGPRLLLLPASITMRNGTSIAMLEATLDGEPVIGTSWSTSDNRIAFLNFSGASSSNAANANGVGTAAISASVNGMSSSSTISVLTGNEAFLGIVVPPVAVLSVGSSSALTYSLNDGGAGITTAVTWSSSDSSKVSVSPSGIVTALAATRGVSICVIATVMPWQRACTLVVVGTLAHDVRILPSAITIGVGQRATLTATLDGAPSSFTWTNLNNAIVSLGFATSGSTNDVIGVAPGKAYVTVTVNGVIFGTLVTVR